MKYVITIVGHLKQEGKPAELPDVVSDYAVVDINSPAELAVQVRHQMVVPLKYQGMLVRKHNTVFDPNKLDTDELVIPLTMFAYIESKVLPLIGEEPIVRVTNDGAELINPSGAPVVKN